MEFYKLNLDSRLQKGISDIGFTEMTDVQEQTLSQTLQGRDVAVQSQTGTGKTWVMHALLIWKYCNAKN